MSDESYLEMRVGDRLPQFTAQALDGLGNPINITGYRAYLCLAAIDTETVFGESSPLVIECSVTDPTQGTVRYDWLQEQVDAATPGFVGASVRFVQIADPDISFEVPTRRYAFVVIRPAVEGGRVYLTTDDGGGLLLSDDGQPMVAI